MKAMVFDRFNSLESFRVADVPVPEPGKGEIRVQVRAATINSWDWELARGDLLARMAAPTGKDKVLGGDLSGIVDKVGEGVTGFSPGDAVYGDVTNCGWGGFAEFATGKAKSFNMKPPELSFSVAATLPQAGMLAMNAVGKFDLVYDTDVLVIGGGGGVGTFAIQLARAAGARVTAIDSALKAETMKRAGAAIVLDHQKHDLDRAGHTYDFIIDPIVSRSLPKQLRLLNTGGTYAVIGGKSWPLLQTALFGPMIAALAEKKATLVMWEPGGAQLDQLAQMVIKGVVRPVIERVFTLDEAPAAMRHFAEGRTAGKVVIVPKPD